MHYVKDIFQGKQSEHAHTKLTRYSKGTFQGPLLEVRFSSKFIKLSGSFHYADELLAIIAKHLKKEIIHIKGSVVWNKDLTKDFESLGMKYVKVTKSRGIFKYVLDNDVEIGPFVELFGKYNLLVSFKFGDISITTKSSFPKPNKEFKADFCKCTFPLALKDEIFSEFLFDVTFDPKIKYVSISHQIQIDDIIMPQGDYTFEEMRRLSKRKGIFTREVELKGKEKELSSAEFEV
jgi:hypothetical protein